MAKDRANRATNRKTTPKEEISDKKILNVLTEGERRFGHFWRIHHVAWKDELFDPMPTLIDKRNTPKETTIVIHSEG